MNTENVLAKIEARPTESQRKLLSFLDRLTQNAKSKPRKAAKHIFKFNWEGGLAGAFGHMTSVKLQHNANEWR